MKVAEGIHLIECPLEGIFTGVYAILGEKVALIDSGLQNSPEGSIFPYLQSLGRDPSEIFLVIVSHGHDDHSGGTGVIKTRSGAKVAAHAADAPYVEDSAKLWSALHERFPKYHPKPGGGRGVGAKVDIALEGGMRIDLGPFEAEVIHTPGHTDGSICLYERKRGILFTGDSVQGRGTPLQSGPLIYGELDDYLGSMSRLISLRPELMLLDHRYSPMESAVLKGPEVFTLLEESIKCVGEISGLVLKSINSRSSTDTDQLVAEVQAVHHGSSSTSMSPCAVVEAVLKNLQKKSLIRGSDAIGWRPAH